jgi:hypothetical protein
LQAVARSCRNDNGPAPGQPVALCDWSHRRPGSAPRDRADDWALAFGLRTQPCDDLVVDERPPDGAGSGSFVTETFDYDGGRQVTVYVPPGSAEGIVFAGDGELLATWGAELEGTDAPATMVVGAHHSADETLRLHEYSPGFDPERFRAHENFLVHGVRQWVATRFGVDLPAERTAAFGVSASAELALALGGASPASLRCRVVCLTGSGISASCGPGVWQHAKAERVSRKVIDRSPRPRGGGGGLRLPDRLDRRRTGRVGWCCHPEQQPAGHCRP